MEIDKTSAGKLQAAIMAHHDFINGVILNKALLDGTNKETCILPSVYYRWCQSSLSVELRDDPANCTYGNQKPDNISAYFVEDLVSSPVALGVIHSLYSNIHTLNKDLYVSCDHTFVQSTLNGHGDERLSLLVEKLAREKAYSAICDNINIAAASVSDAREAVEQIIKITLTIFERISISMVSKGIAKTDIQSDIKDMVEQIKSITALNNNNGHGLLDSGDTISVVTGLIKEGSKFTTTDLKFDKFDMATVITALDRVDVRTTSDTAHITQLLNEISVLLTSLRGAASAFHLIELGIEDKQEDISKVLFNEFGSTSKQAVHQ